MEFRDLGNGLISYFVMDPRVRFFANVLVLVNSYESSQGWRENELIHPSLLLLSYLFFFRHPSLILPYWSMRDPRLTVVIDSSSSSAISLWVLPETRACMILIRSSMVSISWGLNISSRNPSRSSQYFLSSEMMFERRVAWQDICLYKEVNTVSTDICITTIIYWFLKCQIKIILF